MGAEVSRLRCLCESPAVIFYFFPLMTLIQRLQFIIVSVSDVAVHD